MIVMTIYLIKIINIMITTNLTECLKEWKKNILNETDLGGWLGHPVPDYHDIQRVPRGRDRGHLSGHQGHYHHSFMHHLSLLWVFKTIIFLENLSIKGATGRASFFSLSDWWKYSSSRQSTQPSDTWQFSSLLRAIFCAKSPL